MEIGKTEGAVKVGGDQEFSGVAERQDMGKDQFLQLLTAQLAHQDPMNPVEDKEFIAQLAQFSMVEQSVATNKHLEMLGMSVGAVVNAQLPALIGKEITAAGDLATVMDGQSTTLGFALEEAATDVTLRGTDQSGKEVRTINLGGYSAGQHEHQWDGLDNEGNRVPEGIYQIEVSALHGEDVVESSTRLTGVVDGLDFSRGYPELMVGDLRLRPADIIEVRNEE